MTAPQSSQAEAAKLAAILNKIQADQANLGAGASTDQLQNSSIEVTTGRGYIPIFENGQEKHRIGRQPDGTITSVSTGNLNPPLVPNTPVCTPFIGGVTVLCDGFPGVQYLDFSHINVYVDSVIYGTLMKVPEATVAAPLSYGPHTFSLTSVNLSGTESAQSTVVSATPNQIIGDDIAEGIITTLKLADDAVTAAKLAANAVLAGNIADNAVTANALLAGAVTNTKIADNAIDTAQIQAAAVGGAQIAAAAITAANILAGTITTTEIATDTITAGNISANAIGTSELAANVVTAAKIAAGTITATQIATDTIQANNIAAGAVATSELAANSITADKIQANAITAVAIAANAVTATQIQAGSVDATKLAAQIILASTQIIVGNPVAARLVLDSAGLTQIDSKGNIALQFGEDASGNTFTVIDPTDSSNALASIGSDGSMSMTGISINGTASINGVDLINFLNSQPVGIIAKGSFTSSGTVISDTQIGLFEISFNAVAGRVYRLKSDNVFLTSGSAGWLVANYTINGTVPTISSPQLCADMASDRYVDTDITTTVLNWPAAGDSHSHNLPYPTQSARLDAILPSTLTGRIRILVGAYCTWASGATMSLGGYAGTAVNVYIEDLGLTVGNTGGANNGSGTSTATGTFVTTYPATYTKYIGDNVGATMADGLQQGEAGTINYMSMLGFDYTTIVSVLTSATIVKVELYLYSNYWALTEGGTACVGTHNVTGTTPTSYSFVTRDVLDQPMKKPQGLWLQLPTSVGTAFKAATIKGLVLDSRVGSPGTSNYGIFRDNTYIDSTIHPALRITYTK